MFLTRRDPGLVFVRLLGAAEGVEWGFWLAATVWWVVDLGLSPLQLVGMGAVLGASVLLLETPTGVVADLVSRKRSLILGQVVMGISFIWAVSSTNYWVILPAQAFFGLGWTLRSGADTAWVTDELKGDRRGDDISIERLLIRKHRFGIWVALLSMLMTVVIGTTLDVRWASTVIGLVALSLAVLMVLEMTEEHFSPGRDHDESFFSTLRGGMAAVWGRPRLRVLVAVIFVHDLGAEAVDRLGYKHFLDEGGFDDDSLVGAWLLFTAMAVSGLAVNLLSGRALASGTGVGRLATALLATATIGVGLAVASGLLALIGVGLMLQDSARESMWPVLEGWANRDAPSTVRATVHSLLGQVSAIGELIGGLVLGSLAQATSVRLALVVVVGLWAAATLLATRGIDRRPAPRLGAV